MNTRFLLCILLCFWFFSCDYFQPREQPKALARVGENYLYKEDISKLSVGILPKKDSSKVVQTYIDNWITKQAVLQNAENNLTAQELSEVEQKVAEYKSSLIFHLYESKIVKEKLDTLVSDKEIHQYYENHKEDFVIDEPVIKFFRVKSDRSYSSEKVSELNGWLSEFIHSGNDIELAEFCSFNAIDCYTDIDNYVPISTFYETFGLSTSNYRGFSLKTNKLMLYRAANYYYLYQIIDIKKSGYYPESFVKNQIKKLILRKREQQFLEDLRTNVYETAKIKNQIEIYD